MWPATAALRTLAAANLGPQTRRGNASALRLLMTVDTLGGVWTYALDLAAALESSGVRLTVATMGAPLSPTQRASLAQLPHVQLFESCYKLEWMDQPWEDIAQAGDWLLNLESATRPHVVHVNGYVHAALPFRAPTLAVGHSCRCSWFAAVHGHEPPRACDAYRRQVRRGLAAADLVTAPTAAMLSNLRQRYGPFRATSAIPCGHRATALRHPKQPIVLTVAGPWDLGQNLGALDRVAGRLRWPVYVACTAADSADPACDCPGPIDLGTLSDRELTQWYARAAVFALPARYEPSGNAVLQAGLSQCALVLGDIPSLREVWGRAAMFVPPDDPDTLAHAINRLANDDVLRKTYAARAWARARTYTPERMARAYLNLYQRLRQMVDSAPRRIALG